MSFQLDKLYTQSQLVNRAQHLQTVAVEASDQLRDQTVQLMQAQSIRLEDMADTEIEDVTGMDQCMNELMQCILYTELRKDVREVTDRLEQVQHRVFSSKRDLCSDDNAAVDADYSDGVSHAEDAGRCHNDEGDDDDEGGVNGFDGGNDTSNTDIISNDDQEGQEEEEEQENNGGNTTTPTQISTAETFRTARGVPMFSEAENEMPLTTTTHFSSSKASKKRAKIPSTMIADTSSASSSDIAKKDVDDSKAISGTTLIDELTRSVEQLEQQLYGACIEIHEWRRSRCVAEFIDNISAKLPAESATSETAANYRRSPSIVSNTPSSRIPVERIIGEVRERHRMRASSLGHQPTNTHPVSPSSADKLALSLRLSTSPPLSRLLQAEREAESLRQIGLSRPYRSPSLTSRPVPPTATTSSEGAIRPTETSMQADVPHFSSLRLIDTNLTTTTTPASNNNTLSSSSNQQNTERHRTFADDVRIIGWVTRGSGLDVHTEFKVVVHLTRGDNLTVMRRYTDFADLRVVLCERYPTFRKRIPQLPPKKAFGKFEDRFLKKRESGLQFFLAYVMLHPVIGCSSIIKRWLGNAM